MAWQNSKTDWAVNPKNPVPEDFNRIEGNIDFLKGDIETKKGLIVDAINDMNQPAQVTDTHAQLASKIRDISKDATAAVGDVESGKTFYSAGAKKTGTLALSGTAGTGDVLSGKTFYNTDLKTKRTGTMPNRGAVIITPGTSNKAITVGYHNGSGYVKGDSNLKAENIVEGKSIFGVAGNVTGLKVAVGKAYTQGTTYNETITVSGLTFTPRIILARSLRSPDELSPYGEGFIVCDLSMLGGGIGGIFRERNSQYSTIWGVVPVALTIGYGTFTIDVRSSTWDNTQGIDYTVCGW